MVSPPPHLQVVSEDNKRLHSGRFQPIQYCHCTEQQLQYTVSCLELDTIRNCWKTFDYFQNISIQNISQLPKVDQYKRELSLILY